ncbi:hypothetical protein MKOR_11100 [Mycolicibacillus koreensis]|nr:hypothetical protein MKOR_11100 [Mycolicibacillus koreensis]
MPVLQLHAAVLHPHHRTHIAGLGVLDDHPDFDRLLDGAGFAGAVGIAGQHVRSVAVFHGAQSYGRGDSFPGERHSL